MATCTRTDTRVSIRDIEHILEINAIEELQKEVWGCSDRAVVPVAQLAPIRDLGGTLIGAFDGDQLVGFVYGFVGYQHGAAHLHSEMLAVKPGFRNCGIGYRLKLAQRERALEHGFQQITWTFDPLRRLNAHFNIMSLGAVSDEYKVNYYGESTSSLLHVCGTDRLWVRWWLNSERVRARLLAEPDGIEVGWPREAIRLLAVNRDHSPAACGLPAATEGAPVLIEIPADLDAWISERPALFLQWRQSTRQAFTEAIGRGYVIEEFRHGEGSEVCAYLLRPGRPRQAEPATSGGRATENAGRRAKDRVAAPR